MPKIGGRCMVSPTFGATVRLAAFNPADYPRRYRITKFSKVPFFWHLVFVMLFILINAHQLSYIFAAIAIVVAGFALAEKVLVTYTLYPNRIESKTVLGNSAVMLRSDIAGRLGNRPYLVSKNAEPNFYFPGVQPDAAWDAWMDSLPDLDAVNKVADLANPALGKTPDERSRRWRSGQWIARLLFLGSLAAVLLAFMTAGHVGRINGFVLVALPWLAILYTWRWGSIFDGGILRGQSVKTLNLRLTNQIVILMVSAFCSAMGLFVFAYGPSGLAYIDGYGVRILAFALPISAVFLLSFFKVSRVARIPIVAVFCAPFLLPTIVAYGAFATLFVNSLSPDPEENFFETAVSEKRILEDSRGATLQIRFAPWKNQQSGGWYNANNSADFSRFHVSDKVCIKVSLGFLGISTWSVEESCPLG